MQERIELNLSEVFGIMNKKKVIIVGTTVIIAFITAMVNLFVLKPVYQSQASIVVSQEDIMENKAYAYSSDTVTLSQKLLKTYTSIATSEKVLQKTVKDLSLDYNEEQYKSFKKRVFVTYEENTQLLQIAVQDNDPSLAASLTETLTENFMEAAEEFLPMGEMKLLDGATVPNDDIKPNKTLNVTVATALAFIFITTLIILKELKEMKIVNEKDVEKYLNLRVVGIIREMDN